VAQDGGPKFKPWYLKKKKKLKSDGKEPFSMAAWYNCPPKYNFTFPDNEEIEEATRDA
jgi:hypothetical protein